MAGTGPHKPLVAGPGEAQPLPERKPHRLSDTAIAELNEIVTHYPEKREGVRRVSAGDGRLWWGEEAVSRRGAVFSARVTADNVEQIVNQLRSSQEYTPVALADKIVKVQMPGAGEQLSGMMEI